ncbi:MAG: histidinol-phosphate transaminase [Candidatus Obscuribacterales bacterium]|nr:histidinol-phosphate transaminase [Candidatus Obscuribacterales bacterium]
MMNFSPPPTTTIQRLWQMNDPSARAESVTVPKRLVPPHIEALNAYQPGRPPDALKAELGIERFINLASNENPLGPPKSALDAIKAVLTDINRYPESGGFRLRETLADVYRVKAENVVVGSGSESIMANIVRAFLHGDDEVVTSEGTFIGLYVLVNSQGVKLVKVPLKDYKFDLDAIAEAVTEKTKLVYLCNPNNPTGTMFSRAEFENFIKKVPDHVLVILDEAYFEFTMGIAEFPDSMTYRYDNVLTLRSFSKAYAMAGLRVGYGMGHEYLINYVNRVKLPFEPNMLAQVAASAAIKDTTYLGGVLENNDEGMRYLTNEFQKLGWEYVPSSTNFVMLPTKSAEKVKQIHDGLLREGVAIRPLAAFGLPHCFRITIGLPDENEACVNALKKYY